MQYCESIAIGVPRQLGKSTNTQYIPLHPVILLQELLLGPHAQPANYVVFRQGGRELNFPQN